MPKLISSTLVSSTLVAIALCGQAQAMPQTIISVESFSAGGLLDWTGTTAGGNVGGGFDNAFLAVFLEAGETVTVSQSGSFSFGNESGTLFYSFDLTAPATPNGSNYIAAPGIITMSQVIRDPLNPSTIVDQWETPTGGLIADAQVNLFYDTNGPVDGFRIQSVTINSVGTVPEPTSIVVWGGLLVAIGAIRWSQTGKQSELRCN